MQGARETAQGWLLHLLCKHEGHLLIAGQVCDHSSSWPAGKQRKGAQGNLAG